MEFSGDRWIGGLSRHGRLSHVAEAGETLQQAGFNQQGTRQTMFDCLDKDLNRTDLRG